MGNRDFKGDIKVQLIGNVLHTLLGLVTAIFLGRALGAAGRGLLGLALLVPDFLSSVFNLGQDLVNGTFAGLYADRRRNLFFQTILLGIVSAALSILSMLLFYYLPIPRGKFAEVTVSMIWLSILVIPGFLFGRNLLALARGCKQIGWSVQIQLIQALSFLILLGGAYVLDYFTVTSALFLTAVSWLTAIVFSLWKLREYVTFRPRDFSGSLCKKSLGFGTQIGLSTLARLLLLRIDQVILAYMVPLDQVGWYVIAVAFAERLRILPNSISFAFLPHLTNQPDSRRSQVPLVYRLTCLISGGAAFLFAVFGSAAIYWLLGREYYGSIIPFLILLPGIAVQGGTSILANDLSAREKPRYSIVVAYTMLTLNIVLNLIFIPRMGISGAALASLIAYSCAGLLWILFYLRESGISSQELMLRFEDFRVLLKMIHASFRRNLQKYGGGS